MSVCLRSSGRRQAAALPLPLPLPLLSLSTQPPLPPPLLSPPNSPLPSPADWTASPAGRKSSHLFQSRSTTYDLMDELMQTGAPSLSHMPLKNHVIIIQEYCDMGGCGGSG